jgi:hypothetical protein
MNTSPLTTYPVSYSVDYQEGPRDRLTVAFRIFTVIPIAIVLGFVSGGNASAGGIIFVSALLMILFRQKMPRWWFDWNLLFMRFSARVNAYFFLLRDEYPSTDEEQAVHLDYAYPNVPVELNRWLPLVKWLLAIPHYIVLFFLWVAVLVVTVIAWFAILFTGAYPRGMFDFVVGVERWTVRVVAYAILLTTDRYPPFSLQP